jgi:hypothetical protein
MDRIVFVVYRNRIFFVSRLKAALDLPADLRGKFKQLVPQALDSLFFGPAPGAELDLGGGPFQAALEVYQRPDGLAVSFSVIVNSDVREVGVGVFRIHGAAVRLDRVP